ncbi:MAG TPA: FkbM family methyltransferase [Stellaceae bacterium]|nr:FkbM family methyltransferase [Stellaceae bacterium]
MQYATVIDLGCADGHFFVEQYLRGLFAQSVPVNIDANALYEPSLRSIQEVFGGHYRIAAVSDENGGVELTTSIHPYWSSLRDSGDFYWERINKLTSGVQIVPAIRLDDLAAELRLAPPYLLKLDIQGAEVQALRGAKQVLSETNVIICEADLADFQAINAEITGAGFNLFDITNLSYAADQYLGWFYPVYLHARLANVVEAKFWPAAENEAVIQFQEARRRQILKQLAQVLPQIKAARTPRPSG